jgi:hypothetical protein
LAGATHVTVADPLPATAAGAAGAPGTAAGVTAFDAGEASPLPTALVAATVKVYAVPSVKPTTVVDVAGGLPDTTVAVCADAPINGVTV